MTPQTDPQAPALAPDPGVTLEALLLEEIRAQGGEPERAQRISAGCSYCWWCHHDVNDGELHAADCWLIRTLAALARRASLPAEEAPKRSFEWAVANCYTLARRRLRRTDNAAEHEWWQHVARICEEAGVKQPSVLRHSVPTEITDGSGESRASLPTAQVDESVPVKPMQQWHNKKYAGRGVGGFGSFRVVIRTDRKTRQDYIELLHDDDCGGFGFTRRQAMNLISLLQSAVDQIAASRSIPAPTPDDRTDELTGAIAAAIAALERAGNAIHSDVLTVFD